MNRWKRIHFPHRLRQKGRKKCKKDQKYQKIKKSAKELFYFHSVHTLQCLDCYYSKNLTCKQIHYTHWLQQMGGKNQRLRFAEIFSSFPEFRILPLFPSASADQMQILLLFSRINYRCQRALVLITHYTISNEDVYQNEWVKRFAIHSNGQHQQNLGNTKYKIHNTQNTDQEIWMNGRQGLGIHTKYKIENTRIQKYKIPRNLNEWQGLGIHSQDGRY